MKSFDRALTVGELYEDVHKDLAIEWVAGRATAEEKLIEPHDKSRVGSVGHFSMVHAYQIHIMDRAEMDYVSSLKAEMLGTALEKLFGGTCRAVIVAGGNNPTREMRRLAESRGVGLFASALPGEQLANDLHYYLARTLAERTILHGVFMEIINLGVLLAGGSGVGKSELALELISRGHHLIADDAPVFKRIAPDIIEGTSPPAIQDFLEVRGLGILNIRKMYGDSAVKKSKYLRLIINLRHNPAGNEVNEDRLHNIAHGKNVLGRLIPVFNLPVAPGRSLAVLIEAAVRNHLLRLDHYYAEQEISERQLNLMAENQPQ